MSGKGFGERQPTKIDKLIVSRASALITNVSALRAGASVTSENRFSCLGSKVLRGACE